MSTESENQTLKTYVNDMLALQRHILEAIEHQYEDERVKNDARAFDLIGKVRSTLGHHVTELEGHVSRLGSSVTATAKAAVTQAAGIVAGLYDKVRKDPVSRMLRDDYTALNLASFSYTMLHTTALAFKDAGVAETAVKHLQDLTPIIVHYNQIVPYVVVEELRDENPAVDAAVAETAIKNTQYAWKP